MQLPVSSRVGVLRIIALAVALCIGWILGAIPGALPTAAMARQFRDAGARIEGYPTRKPFQAAMAALYATAPCDPATAEWIERIRKSE
jgi:hypothetical protein